MTMSVGLGKITNDPTASVLTRNALGALATPGLLVHDTGITIDDDGRITLRLKPDGGLTQDETGVSMDGSVRIDSITIDDNESGVGIRLGILNGLDRWNLYITGTAPNYFRESVRIGTTDAAAKLTVEDVGEQLRLRYDANNYLKITVDPDGTTTFEPVGTDADLDFVTSGSGSVKINGEVPLFPDILTATASLTLTMDLAGIEEISMSVPGAVFGDSVIVNPEGSPNSAGIMSWSGYVKSANVVTIRVRVVVVEPWQFVSDTRNWTAMVIRM